MFSTLQVHALLWKAALFDSLKHEQRAELRRPCISQGAGDLCSPLLNSLADDIRFTSVSCALRYLRHTPSRECATPRETQQADETGSATQKQRQDKLLDVGP